ncbi:hypothetical protein OE88DRAFT_147037 [Heliocybe sulcata]|uniref:Uncharacterized protein n=1 Tax=Heliocybe sulcata TaxID=5364 RepID=A0A5C3NJH5_9AGAM|nr:hypothetical protein OE88DRAFT_147037 [Heliocybe sulcata]
MLPISLNPYLHCQGPCLPVDNNEWTTIYYDIVITSEGVGFDSRAKPILSGLSAQLWLNRLRASYILRGGTVLFTKTGWECASEQRILCSGKPGGSSASRLSLMTDLRASNEPRVTLCFLPATRRKV